MRSVQNLLLHLLALAPFAIEPSAARRDRQDQNVLLPGPVIDSPGPVSNTVPPRHHEFTLRHIFHKGSHQYPLLHRKIDIHSNTQLLQTTEDGIPLDLSGPIRVQSRGTTIQRMADRSRKTVDGLLEAGRMRGEAVSLPPSAWTIDEIAGPNVTDKETILSFARMAANAYEQIPNKGEWEDVGGGFNYTEDFGWQLDGLRGHIFADTENKTLVIGLKGTSPAVFDGADTTGNDKLNDNLFGSCCCGQGGQYMWKQVCDCQTSTYTCNSTCLVKNLREKGHYYTAVQELYHNVTALYPDADVWLTGHSLGGVVSSLLGLTFGLPTITFEAFPDALAAGRLGLPTPPGYHIGRHQARPHTGAWHFGHTADPVYMGICNAASSFCTIGGYAFQSQCHTGSSCTYDTVADLGWRVAIGTHTIRSVIRDVILKYDTVPECTEDTDCIDCFSWKFFESNGTETTTASSKPTSTSTSLTRTETCKTPGWWGCLDESTTAHTTTMTSTVTTTTCLTPGWFGCKDLKTTTQTTTITSPTPEPAPTLTTGSSVPTSTSTLTSDMPTSSATSSTSTCKTPGWFGCKDATTSSVKSAVSTAPATTKPAMIDL